MHDISQPEFQPPPPLALIGTLRSNNADVVQYAVAAWALCRGRRVCGGKNKLRWRGPATRRLTDRIKRVAKLVYFGELTETVYSSVFSVYGDFQGNSRNFFLASYASNIITIEEYALLFEKNSSNNLDFPFYNYPLFNLESQSEAECRANFRVEKHHIPLVEDVLQIQQYFVCDQGMVCEGTEGLCIILKRYSFPCRYSDMIPI